MSDDSTDNAAFDRRAALAKAAAAGAVAWTTPLVLSRSAHAADTGTCTPRCTPTGRPDVTAPEATTACDELDEDEPPRIRGSFGVTTDGFEDPVVCPCGGRATLTVNLQDTNTGTVTEFAVDGRNVTFAVELPTTPFRGTLSVSFELVLSCSDRTGDACTRSCQVGFQVGVVSEGTCAGLSVGQAEIFFDC